MWKKPPKFEKNPPKFEKFVTKLVGRRRQIVRFPVRLSGNLTSDRQTLTSDRQISRQIVRKSDVRSSDSDVRLSDFPSDRQEI